MIDYGMGEVFVHPGMLELVHPSCSHWGLFFSDRKGHVRVSLAGVSFPFLFLCFCSTLWKKLTLVTDNIAIHYWYQARNLILNYNPWSGCSSSFAVQTHLNTAPHSPSWMASFCHDDCNLFIYIYKVHFATSTCQFLVLLSASIYPSNQSIYIYFHIWPHSGIYRH